MQMYRRIDKAGNETWSGMPPWWHFWAICLVAMVVSVPVTVGLLFGAELLASATPLAEWGADLADWLGIPPAEKQTAYDILTAQN